MKRLLGALAALLCFGAAAPALATNCSSNPFNLTNGSTADASQVMANFNNLLNCSNNNLAPIASPTFTGVVTTPGLVSTGDITVDGVTYFGGTTTFKALMNSGSPTLAFASGVYLNYSGGDLVLNNTAGKYVYVDNTGSLFTVGGLTAGTGLTVTTGGISVTAGKTALSPSTTSAASLNCPNGTAPSSPAAGDEWCASGAHLHFDGGTTRTFAYADATNIAAGTTSAKGALQLATSAQALAGTDTTHPVTSSGLASQTNIGSTNGFATLPGGAIYEWGQTVSITSGNSSTFNMPLACPTNAPFSVQATATIGGTNGVSVTNATQTQLTIRNDKSSTQNVYWFAVCN